MRIPLLLYGLTVAVRLVLIAHFPYPAYADSAYYADVASNLHAGLGFNVDFIWIFAEVGGILPADPVLPIPSNAHWMPLASIVQVPFISIFGNVAWAAALPFALIGAIASPLAWGFARDAGAGRTVAVGAGILTAIPLLSTVYLVQTDNFSLFQPLVLGSLWLAARALRGSGRAFVGAGLLAGLATFARTDGVLVLATLGLLFAWDRWRAWRSAGARTPSISVAAAVGCVAVFVLVMAPWWARQLAVFGSLSPSTASGKVLFIRSIDEWDSITTPATLEHLLGMGIGPLLATRVGGLVAALMIYITLVGGVILAPLMVIGAWGRRRSRDFRPFFIYAGFLFAFSALVSAVHVPGGTFIHSAIALAPFTYILVLEGIALVVRWVAARRPAWDAPTATRIFSGAIIGFAVLCSVVGAAFAHGVWEGRRERGLAVAMALDDAGAATTDRVMSLDAASTKYWTGRGGVVLVNDPIDTIRQVADAYDIRWLVLDKDDTVPAALPVLAGDRPSWIGTPLDTGIDGLAVYPVDPLPMTRREAVVSALSIFAVALVVRAWFASQVPFPELQDAAYYFGVARNLVEGRGLVSDAIWSYQTPPLVFPRPAFEVWLPLPSLLASIPMAIAGATFAASQVSAVVVGAIVPVLAWRLAADVATERALSLSRGRTLAIGTGLVTAVYLPLLIHSALPDSTMLFTVLALAACLLMSRLAGAANPVGLADRRVIALGVVMGLAALTRNEAIWLGFIWLLIAWRAGQLRLVVAVGAIALLVFAPWMIRDWLIFGSPLPGQAVANAFSVTGLDIFAWNDPPTLSRYLAVGPARLVEMRIEGLSHNLFTVLLLPGVPLSVIGLAALPWQARGAALRPVVLLALITFLATSLIFPVATTWGTFLHAAGPVQVLIVLSALLALDAGIARLGQRLGWTRPVAWLGPALGIFGSVLFSAVLLTGFASGARGTAAQFEELERRMAAIGHPLDETAGPVLTDYPIWLAEASRIPTLALPDEPPSDVLDLTRQPEFAGTRLLVLIGGDHGRWPDVLETGAPDAECFRELDLGSAPAGVEDPLRETRAFEVVCR